MNLIYFIPLLIFLYLFILGLFPRLLMHAINKLFTYNKNKKWPQKIENLIYTYLFLGIIMGLLFSPLFGIQIESFQRILNLGNFDSSAIIFITCSFFFIWSIRLTTLLDKSNFIYCCSPLFKERIQNFFNNVNKKCIIHGLWKKQRNFMESFLFSLFLFAILSSITYFMFTRVINYTTSTLFTFGGSIEGSDLITLSLIGLSVLILTSIFILLGEYLIDKYGVHGELI